MNEIFGILILFAPVMVILWLANYAEGQRQPERPYGVPAVISYFLVFFFYAGAALIGLLIQIGGELLRQRPDVLNEFSRTLNMLLAQQPNFPKDIDVAQLVVEMVNNVASFRLLGMGLWIPAALSVLLLLPPVRRLFALFLPIDAASPVHAVALSLIGLVAINLCFTLGIGLLNLAKLVEAQQATGQSSNTTLTLWAQQIFTTIFAMIGVGWFTRRDWSQTWERLKITRPTGRQILIGIGLGLLMVPVSITIENLSANLNFVVDPGVNKLTEQLLGPLFHTPLGIVTLGVSAAIGEEPLFRGALQPRFGIVLTSLLFALVHSNYGISVATLIVFTLSLVLGFVRNRYNTSTSMILHAVYNMTLGVLAYLGV